jgi:hypothetical protein
LVGPIHFSRVVPFDTRGAHFDTAASSVVVKNAANLVFTMDVHHNLAGAAIAD